MMMKAEWPEVMINFTINCRIRTNVLMTKVLRAAPSTVPTIVL